MLIAIPKLQDLIADPTRVKDLPAEVVPELRAELARIDSLLLARLIATANSHVRRDESVTEEKLLTAEEAAPILGVKPRWLYRHAKKLSFARRLSRKVLRFEENGLRKWQERQRA
jgi:hypothetical protein